jgi:predicted anti-sigma-YlaC factor YlaD
VIEQGHNNEHVGEWLSGYIDGELTQQQRQRVALHCETCAECRELLEELETLRERMGRARLSRVGEDKWRETMNDNTVNTLQSIGWVLLIGGAIGLFLLFLHGVFIESGMSTGEKMIFFGIYGGLGALLVSVLRQRMVESKTDKYKDVEI